MSFHQNNWNLLDEFIKAKLSSLILKFDTSLVQEWSWSVIELYIVEEVMISIELICCA